MTRERPGDPSRHGVGLGLRFEHLEEVVDRLAAGTLTTADVPFVEVAPENYLRRGGFVGESLDYVGAHLPLVSHGIHLSLGGTAPFDAAYLAALRGLLARIDAPWHSDHLCFSGVDDRSLHELLPLPRTAEVARHVAARVREARERLERPMAVENVTWYFELGGSELDEASFVGAVLEEADCGLLLDVNNAYVNALNHGGDARAFVEAIDPARVWQLHVAGHEARPSEGLVIDTHGADVIEPVVELMRLAVARTGPLPVVLERDSNLPSLDALVAERRRLQAVYDAAVAQHFAGAVGGRRD